MSVFEIVGGLFDGKSDQVTLTMSYITGTSLLLFLAYEWLMHRYTDGKKTSIDWKMAGLSIGFLVAVQRPALTIFLFLSLSLLLPDYAGYFQDWDSQYFWPGVCLYSLIDEYLHGRTHLLTHGSRPQSRILQRVQGFLKVAHRPHHLIGGNDGKGQLTATHTYVEHWGWWLVLPNYWFGIICFYLGFYEIFLWGTAIKAVWGMHVHTNWGRSYDIYLLNHRSPVVRKIMFMLCHVFVFPNMHQHHHSRGANSAKNMTNFIAVFDWLLWDSLVIEKERPEVCGWRQAAEEEHSALYRYFNTSFRR